jgi:serine/threonine-protein kinase
MEAPMREPENVRPASAAPQTPPHDANQPTIAHDPWKTVYRPPTDAGSDPSLPDVPGHILLEELGRGGMGVVFKAWQPSLRRMVALKTIRPGSGVTPEMVARFRDEAQAAARLDHENIVHVNDSGEADGQLYFSMELVDGGSLAERLHREGPIPPLQSARLVRTLARAVQEAHRLRIVHRDLKPANVLLTAPRPGKPLGVPKIADFGLARQLNQTGQTQTGQVFGTPAYMAPEQFAGKPSEVREAADIFALGAILYECLTGKPPARDGRGSSGNPSAPPSAGSPSKPPRAAAPSRLREIYKKCLKEDPAERYPSAEALADDLDAYVNAEAARIPRRRWLVVGAVAAAIGVFFVALNLFGDKKPVVNGGTPVEDPDPPKREEAKQLIEKAGRTSDNVAAVGLYTRAFDLLTKVAQDHPQDRDTRFIRDCVRIDRGNRYYKMRQWKSAEQDFDAARTHLTQLTDTDDADPRFRLKLAEAFHNLGMLWDAQAKRHIALKNYEDALQLRQKLHDENRGSRDYLRDLARSYGFMGDTELDLSQFRAAEFSYKRSEELRAELVKLLREDPTVNPAELCLARLQLARSYGNSANLAGRQNKTAEALEHSRRRLRELESIHKDCGTIPPEFDGDLPDAYVNAAELALDLGDGSDPRPGELLDKADKLYAVLAKENPKSPDVLVSRAAAAVVRAKGKLAKPADTAAALAALDDAQSIYESFDQAGMPKPSDDDLYRIAQVYGLRSQACEGQTANVGNEALADHYLQKAVAAGFTDLPKLERDSALKSFYASRPEAWRTKFIERVNANVRGG